MYREFAQDLVSRAFDGINGTIFAYGQTGAHQPRWHQPTRVTWHNAGSGKSYTITGATDVFEQRGIIPRALAQIFQNVTDNPDISVNVRISYLEIYNEQLRDLLVPDSDAAKTELQIVDTNGKNPAVKGTLCGGQLRHGSLRV